jgi:GTP-binding protein
VKETPKKKVRGKALHTKPAAPAAKESRATQAPGGPPKAPTAAPAALRPSARAAARAQADKGEAARTGDRVIGADFKAGATAPDQFPAPTLVEIAFAGRSNVGKSSLLNRLMERRSLVRTSSTPGCTRQISWFEAECDDRARLCLVDLPGYGYARRSKSERAQWGDLIDRYLLERPTLRGVALLTDVRRGLEEDDLELLKMLATPAHTSRPPVEVVLVATKLDKLPAAQRNVRLAELRQKARVPVFGFSAVTGAGRTELWREVRRILGVGVAPTG